MAFWGIQVKAGKPYTHEHQLMRRRLHISQATIGSEGSTNKSIFLQCNVGDKVPVLLCSLIPEKTESCPLNLEFDEAQDVVFSVIGTKTVHLTGYYLTHNSHSQLRNDDDTESYGEDIAETESSESNDDNDSLDTYEDDFIDDGEPEVFPPSPQCGDKDVSEEIEEEEQPMRETRIRRRLVKKHHLSDSDGGDGFLQKSLPKGTSRALVLDSEDEDVLPLGSRAEPSEKSKKKEENDITQIIDDKNDELSISFITKSKRTCQNEDAKDKLDEKTSEAGQKSKKKADDDISQVTTLKRRVNAIDQRSNIESKTIQSCDSPLSSLEVGAENVMGLKKKRKIIGEGRKSLEPKANLSTDEKVNRDRDTTRDDSKSDVQRVKNVQLEDAKVSNMDQSLPAKVEDEKLYKDMKVINSLSPSGTVTPKHSPNVKEKRKGKTKDKISQAVDKTGDETLHNQKKVVEDGKIVNENKLLNSKEAGRIAKLDQDMPINAQEPNAMLLDDKSPDVNSDHANSNTQKEKKKKKKVKVHESDTNSNKEEPNAMLMDDKSLDANSGHANSYPKKEEKKKKVKVHESNTLSNKEEYQLVTGESEKVINEIEEQKNEVQQPLTGRTSSNGMVIEELLRGSREGKHASHGNKVYVHYTCKVKDGKVLDSTIGKKPSKFRLGKQQVIEGMDIGLEGMYVGDKRRLVIPPAMGYGIEGEGEVPGNAWLIIDVELIKVN